MLQALFPWLVALFSLSLAYPWVRWLLAATHPPQSPPRREPVLILLLTVGLSLGALTWALLMLSALSKSLAAFWPVTVLMLIFHAGGWIVWRRYRQAHPEVSPHRGRHLRWPGWITAMTIALIGLLIVLVLFNAAYWPVFEDDAATLYGPIGLDFVRTGDISGHNEYDAYPVLDPLVFAYLHLAHGAPHEYASRFVMAVLALGSVGAVYVLGRDVNQQDEERNRRVGLAAAFLLVTIPIVPHWAASAYTDLPAGTYYLLAMIFAWRLFQHPHPLLALLTGLLAGLAAFTKNGALLIVGSLAGWVVYTHWVNWQQPQAGQHPIRLSHAGLAAGGFLLVAGPWYGHNVLEFGYLVPPTGWTDQANHTLRWLVGPSLTTTHFMLGGVLGQAGMLAMLAALWRSRWGFSPQAVLLLGFGVPFWLVWWWYFSYDLRFLLLVWGVFAVMGGLLIMQVYDRLPARSMRGILVLMPVILVVLALPAMRWSVDHKPDIFRDPFMDDYERHRIQIGPRYEVMAWLWENVPAGSAVLGGDYQFAYTLARHDLRFILTPPWAVAELIPQADYWVWQPGFELSDVPDGYTVESVQEMHGLVVYRIVKPE